MASIYREIEIRAAPAAVWAAMRDVGAIHERLVKGFVVACELKGDVRHLTFANGLVASERIITVDDEARRVAWSASGGRLAHHNASSQVFEVSPAVSRVVWVCDLLPDDLAPAIDSMIQAGLAAMKRTLEGAKAGNM